MDGEDTRHGTCIMVVVVVVVLVVLVVLVVMMLMYCCMMESGVDDLACKVSQARSDCLPRHVRN